MKKSATRPTQYSAANKAATTSPVVTRLPVKRKFKKRTGKAATVDPVDATFLTMELAELESVIQESPTINASKIVDIHSRINTGGYKIDVDRLAGKLIDLESSLD